MVRYSFSGQGKGQWSDSPHWLRVRLTIVVVLGRSLSSIIVIVSGRHWHQPWLLLLSSSAGVVADCGHHHCHWPWLSLTSSIMVVIDIANHGRCRHWPWSLVVIGRGCWSSSAMILFVVIGCDHLCCRPWLSVVLVIGRGHRCYGRLLMVVVVITHCCCHRHCRKSITRVRNLWTSRAKGKKG
jgi:hypothetical protein